MYTIKRRNKIFLISRRQMENYIMRVHDKIRVYNFYINVNDFNKTDIVSTDLKIIIIIIF